MRKSNNEWDFIPAVFKDRCK